MILASWPQWILAICAAASCLCLVIGGSIAAVALARFSKRAARTSAAVSALVDAKRTQADIARINLALEALPPLIERARQASASIDASLKALRLPEAMLALRTARSAVRLLLSGR